MKKFACPRSSNRLSAETDLNPRYLKLFGQLDPTASLLLQVTQIYTKSYSLVLSCWFSLVLVKPFSFFASSASSFPNDQFHFGRPNITGEEICTGSQHKIHMLDFLNWTHGNRVQPDSFINHNFSATSAKNQIKNESPKYSITNMNITFNLDLASGLIVSFSPMVLLWGDWVSSLPSW